MNSSKRTNQHPHGHPQPDDKSAVNRSAILVARDAELERILGSQLPEWDDTVCREAEEAVAGRILYVDDRFVEIGRRGIDWTASHIDEHTWKARPQRFLYLRPLAAAYLRTGREEFAHAAADYVADWAMAHPPVPDWKIPPYDNSLNLAVRVANIAAVLGTFSRSVAWDDGMFGAAFGVIQQELGFIRRNLSPAGNFRMKQAMTLIECGLRFPFLPEAADWLHCGVTVMNDAARRQVHPDGAHIECTGGYHIWMTELLGNCHLLGRAFPDAGFAIDSALVLRMFDYAVADTKPNGFASGLNDYEGAWEGVGPFNAEKKREHFCRIAGLEIPPPRGSMVFRDAGQAFLRSGHGPDAGFLSFDAFRWGSAHGHLARNGIQFHSGGRTHIFDPGRIAYEMRNPLGPYCKSTRAHSTVNLNGWNQFRTNPDVFRAGFASGYDFVSSRYSGGYWPGEFGWWFTEGLGKGLAAVHTRHVFWVHSRWALVVDEVLRWNEVLVTEASHQSPSLELNWQCAPGPMEIDQERRRVITGDPQESALMIALLHGPEGMKIVRHEGETDPHRGWVRCADRFDGCPAPQATFVCEPWQDYESTLVSLLIPFAGAPAPEFRATLSPGTDHAPFELLLEWVDGTKESVLWRHGMEVMLGETPYGGTDGVLLYHRACQADHSRASAIVDATHGPIDAVRIDLKS